MTMLVGLLLAAVLPTSWPPLDRTPTAFVEVRVLTLDGQDLERGTVVVADGRIVAVGPASEVPVPLDAMIVSGEGLTLLPGLVDMHVHLGASTLGDYVAHGVTSVRNMWGFARLPALAADVAAGRRLGPAISSASPGIDGLPVSWPETVILEDASAADAVVRAQKDAGWASVKLYQRLRADVYAALLAAARRQGMSAVGHVPTASSLGVALDGGQASIEHLGGYERATSGSPVIGLGGWTSADPARMDSWAARTAAAGTWNCPTQVIFATVARRNGSPDLQRAMENRRLMIAALHRHGARLLAGSDAGVNGTVEAGSGLLEELELLVAAGLTPVEAIRAATADAAAFLGQEAEIGHIRPGWRADLLLVAGDPRVDVAAVRRQAGVMLRGRWIPFTD
jgi:imidazolonepropionase-like amidohydrolase